MDKNNMISDVVWSFEARLLNVWIISYKVIKACQYNRGNNNDSNLFFYYWLDTLHVEWTEKERQVTTEMQHSREVEK